MPPWQRPPRPEPAPRLRPSAVHEILIAGEDFENKPWYGASSGAMLPPPSPSPPTPVEKLNIEPPPWSENYVGEAAVDATEPDAEPAPPPRAEIPPPPWSEDYRGEDETLEAYPARPRRKPKEQP